ncbi:unnamed protein product, partial [Ixodes pacificus]
WSTLPPGYLGRRPCQGHVDDSGERGRSGLPSECRRAFLEKLSLNEPVRGARRYSPAVPRAPRILSRETETMPCAARGLAPRRYCWRWVVASDSTPSVTFSCFVL